MTNDTLNTVQALARRCLWIAYCWNDHNFDAAYGYARETAKAHGINSLEDANALIEQIEQMLLRGAPFAVDILGNPMREYEPGKWEVAQWPSEASDRGTQPDPSQSSKALSDEVCALLDGIDRTQTEKPDGGWWETSTGAEFGEAKLTALLAILASAGITRRESNCED